MANYFLSLLPFTPKRPKTEAGRRPKTILPAEDIMDFHYPPQSRFNREDETSDEQDLLQG